MVYANYILIVVAVSLPFFLGLTYMLSVLSNHVNPVWPYVSLTGNYPIECCIFSFALNVTAGIFELLVLIRYFQVAQVVKEARLVEEKSRKAKKWNVVSLSMGTMGSVGVSMAGSFQQKNFHFAHLLGFFFSSTGILGFMLSQAYFSFTTMLQRTHPWIRKYRLFACIASTAIYSWGPALLIYHRISNPNKPIPWTLSGEVFNGNPMYLATSVLEWILLFFHLSFIATMYPDYRKIDLKSDRIIFLE